MRRCLGVLLALVLGFTTSMASPLLSYDHQVFLPLAMRSPCPPVRVFDKYGQPRDWAWLEQTFGAVWIEPGGGSSCVVELRDEEGPASITVTVIDAEGGRVGGQEVVFYWPDAPDLPDDLWGCYTQGIHATTKDSGTDKGTIGFGMGGGSYYFAPGGGPHTIWVGVTGSDCVHGLGMLGGTNHRHLNPTFMLLGPAVLQRNREDARDRVWPTVPEPSPDTAEDTQGLGRSLHP
jgi:hypothetical protein